MYVTDLPRLIYKDVSVTNIQVQIVMQYNYTSSDIIKTDTCITFNFYFTLILLMGVCAG